MADIFISYSKADPKPTESLAAALRGRRYTVWWDTNLLTGDDFRKIIIRELEAAQAAIVVWTSSSIKSEWVISEAERAKSMKKLLPVRARGLEVRDIPPPFDILHTDFWDDFDRVFNALRAKGVSPSIANPDSGSMKPKTPTQAAPSSPPNVGGPASQVQWYLARNGEQFGPTSDSQMEKFVETGHLKATDLLWREGFPDWRPALTVFPPRQSR